MHPHAMKVQQNGRKSCAAFPSQKNDNSKNSFNLFFHAVHNMWPC